MIIVFAFNNKKVYKESINPDVSVGAPTKASGLTRNPPGAGPF